MESPLEDPQVCSKIFFPRKSKRIISERTAIITSGDVELVCFHDTVPVPLLQYLKSFFSATTATPTVLFFHGNGELVDDYVLTYTAELLDIGVNAFFAEYRGYGSSTGTPSIPGIFYDLEAIHDYLVNTLHIREQDIIVHGRSLGGLFATEFATRYNNIRGLIIESSFRDPSELIIKRIRADATLTPEFIAKLPQVEQEIANIAHNSNKLSKLPAHIPVLIMHAEDDNLIPAQHARDNYKASVSSNKRLVMYPIGKHNSIRSVNKEVYEFEGKQCGGFYQDIQAFISSTSN